MGSTTMWQELASEDLWKNGGIGAVLLTVLWRMMVMFKNNDRATAFDADRRKDLSDENQFLHNKIEEKDKVIRQLNDKLMEEAVKNAKLQSALDYYEKQREGSVSNDA